MLNKITNSILRSELPLLTLLYFLSWWIIKNNPGSKEDYIIFSLGFLLSGIESFVIRKENNGEVVGFGGGEVDERGLGFALYLFGFCGASMVFNFLFKSELTQGWINLDASFNASLFTFMIYSRFLLFWMNPEGV